jgi:hypothetical protein
MVTIKEIVRNGRGKSHAWKVTEEKTDWGTICTLWHYSTKMLVWLRESPANTLWLDYSVGWGSVSDQNGMNTAFRELGLNLRFDRDNKGGGARITELGPLWDQWRELYRDGSTRMSYEEYRKVTSA